MTITTSPPPPGVSDAGAEPGQEPEAEPAAAGEPGAVLPTGPECTADVAAAEPPPAPAVRPWAPGAPAAAAGAGDGFQPETIRWRWAALGFAVIAALHALVVLATPGRTVLAIGLGLAPYLVGGVLLGVLTRGRSMLEPFYGAVAPALVFPFVAELMRVQATHPPDVAQTMARVQWLAVLAPTLVYVLVALLGFWVGDRFMRWRRGGAKVAPALAGR